MMLGCILRYLSIKNVLVLSLLIMTVFLPLLLQSCSKKEQSKSNEVPVKTYQVKLQPVEIAVEYISTLLSRKSTDLYPRVDGPIDKIYVHDGDIVKKGSIIMSIESSKQSAVFSSSKANVKSASETLNQNRATLESYKADKLASESALIKAKRDYERTLDLFEKGSETQANLDSSTNDYNKAKADLSSIEEQIKAQEMFINSKEADYDQAVEQSKQEKITYDYYFIKAPYDGKIGYIPVRVGQYVSTNTLLTNITENDILEIQIAVDVSHREQLKKGMKIKIYDTDDNVISEDKVYFIAPNVNVQTQTVLVNALLHNKDNLYNVGEVIKAKLIFDVKDKLTIPTESVMHAAGQDYVFAVEKQKGAMVATQKPVTLGEIQNNKYIVESGLKEGETIVSSGILKLRNGTPVKVQK